MFNNKKIKELTEKLENLEKKHSLLIEYLKLTEKFELKRYYGFGFCPTIKIFAGYEPMKRCKTCKKIQNDI